MRLGASPFAAYPTTILERIVSEPTVHFGKPCVKGTRIPVYCVLELVEQGISFDDITRDYYPDISSDDVRACVRYATALRLLESLDGEPDEDVEAAWAAEIQRRVQKVRSGRAQFEDWDMVKQRLRP